MKSLFDKRMFVRKSLVWLSLAWVMLLSSPLAADTALITVRAFDEAGLTEIDTITVGSRFTLKVQAADTRAVDPLGVFAAYLDILYDADKLSIVTDPVFTVPDCAGFSHGRQSFVNFHAPFSCGIEDGSLAEPGRWDAVGAFIGLLEPNGPEPADVFSVMVEATGMGEANIIAESTSNPSDPFDLDQSIPFGTLVSGQDDFVCPNTQNCVGTAVFQGDSITIVPEPQTDLLYGLVCVFFVWVRRRTRG